MRLTWCGWLSRRPSGPVARRSPGSSGSGCLSRGAQYAADEDEQIDGVFEGHDTGETLVWSEEVERRRDVLETRMGDWGQYLGEVLGFCDHAWGTAVAAAEALDSGQAVRICGVIRVVPDMMWRAYDEWRVLRDEYDRLPVSSQRQRILQQMAKQYARARIRPREDGNAQVPRGYGRSGAMAVHTRRRSRSSSSASSSVHSSW